MTPTREFLDNNPTMLAEMIADFQQRKKIVDMAKTREPIDANVIDNPNLRAFIPYPRLMYHHAQRSTMQVNNIEEQEGATLAGWRTDPWSETRITPPVQIIDDSGTEERLDSLERRMTEIERGMGDILAQLQLLTLPEKRKPGRPPAHSQE